MFYYNLQAEQADQPPVVGISERLECAHIVRNAAKPRHVLVIPSVRGCTGVSSPTDGDLGETHRVKVASLMANPV